MNPCTSDKPCQNGGVCTVTGDDSYSCECADGYVGQNCEQGTGTIKMVALDIVCAASHNVSFP